MPERQRHQLLLFGCRPSQRQRLCNRFGLLSLVAEKGFVPLEWTVYSGPSLLRSEVPPAWEAAMCSMPELATILTSRDIPCRPGRNRTTGIG